MGRRRLLVPEARAAMNGLKKDVARELRRAPEDALPDRRRPPAAGTLAPPPASPAPGAEEDGGALTTEQAGRMGGPIGGNMVRRLIELAKDELAAEDPGRRP